MRSSRNFDFDLGLAGLRHRDALDSPLEPLLELGGPVLDERRRANNDGLPDRRCTSRIQFCINARSGPDSEETPEK